MDQSAVEATDRKIGLYTEQITAVPTMDQSMYNCIVQRTECSGSYGQEDCTVVYCSAHYGAVHSAVEATDRKIGAKRGNSAEGEAGPYLLAQTHVVGYG